MPNYIYGGGGMASGIAQGIQSGISIGEYLKQQALEGDLAEASKAQLEEVPGAEGAAPASWKLGGQSYANKPHDYQTDLDRSNMIASVYEKHGKPDKAISLRASANQNYKLAQDSAVEKEMADAATNSSSGSIIKANQEAQAAYEKQLADYKAAETSGSDLGPAPTPPTLQRPSHLDWLNDIGSQLAIRAKHGKFDPEIAMKFAQTVDTVKKEGTAEALNMLNAGDVQGAIKKWNETGEHRIDPASVTPREVVVDVNGTKIKTWELTVKNPDGTTTTINAAKSLQGLDKIENTMRMVIASNADHRAAAESGRSATRFANEQDDRKATIAGNTALGGIQTPEMMADPAIAKMVGIKGVEAVLPTAQRQAQTTTFKTDNPSARPDQTNLVSLGLPQVAEKSVDQVIRGQVATQNQPEATPTTIQAIAKGIDPMLGKDGAKGDAAATLYKQYYPDATDVELRAAKLGVIKVEDGMKSSFVPNQMMGGGVIQQSDRHGNITVTTVKSDGSFGETTTVSRPGNPTKANASAQGNKKSTGVKQGQVVDGYRFKGGDPKSPSNWEPAK